MLVYASIITCLFFFKNCVCFSQIAATAATSLDIQACVVYCAIPAVIILMWWRDSAYTRNVAFPFNSRESLDFRKSWCVGVAGGGAAILIAHVAKIIYPPTMHARRR